MLDQLREADAVADHAPEEDTDAAEASLSDVTLAATQGH